MRTLRQNTNLSRRKFIVTSAAAGGGLALGLKLPFVSAARAQATAAVAGTEVNHWVVVTARRHLRDPHRARGDGTGHAHRPRAARRRRARVRLEQSRRSSRSRRRRTSHASACGATCRTGGSRGIRGFAGLRIAQGGAAARIDAAAGGGERMGRAGRASSPCPNGVITHAASNRSTTYGKVAAGSREAHAARSQEHQAEGRSEWKIAGKPLKRLDTATKLNGSQMYAIDAKLPGMLNAAIKQCPVFGGKLVSYDEAEGRRTMPGVQARREGR